MLTEGELIKRLTAGDLSGWCDVVRRHTPLVWTVARSFRLDQADAADVVQSTWAAFAEHLPRLTMPDRLGAWLVTTARRESQRMRDRREREQLADSVEGLVDGGPEPVTLCSAEDRALRRAFDALPITCRTMLALHANAPELSYTQLGAALEMNAASVGRTRTRCLDHLRRLLDRVDDLAVDRVSGL